ADDMWLPHPKNATWTYSWTDSVYAKTPTLEKVTVKKTEGTTFDLAWTTQGLKNPDDAVSSTGTVSFAETSLGIVNTNWPSDPPPARSRTLGAGASSGGNSVASTYYNIIWGSRNPVLAEPLLKGVAWAGSGGSQNDVTSTSIYDGTQKVTVPAFPHGVI